MIKSVEKALGILSYMLNRGPADPVPLSVIAEACGLPKATCSHLVDSLCACAYMEKISRKDGYILGPMGYSISSKQYYRHELIETALPIMKRISRQLGENMSISTFANNRLFVPLTVQYEDSGPKIQMLKSGNLYSSASGRMILAYMPPRRLDELLAAIGFPKRSDWDVGPDRQSLEAALREIRQMNMAITRRVAGSLSAVASPILVEGKLQAVVGIYMDDERFQGEHLGECVRQTALAAKLISLRLTERLTDAQGVVYRANQALE